MARYRVHYEDVKVYEVEVELQGKVLDMEELKVQTFKHHYGLRPTAFFKNVNFVKDLNSGVMWHVDGEGQLDMIHTNLHLKGREE
jgi:hypothetical protein